MDKEPVIAARKPFYRELRAGQRVSWCRCGRSTRQPFCDGRSHEGTGFEPVVYQAAEAEEVLFCGCKRTCTPPFCDGSHSNLPGGYRDEEGEPGGGGQALMPPDEAGFARLDGHCYVVTPPAAVSSSAYSCDRLVSPTLGAEHQAQFHIWLRDGESPVLASAFGDVVLWVRAGIGEVEIGSRRFPIKGMSGVSIRRGETFRLSCQGDTLDVYVSVCPGGDTLDAQNTMLDNFDTEWLDRVVTIDEDRRQAMGPRWFQTLVDERHGLWNTAQFVGHIPRSQAEMHKHLYEEALIILSGAGIIWNETLRAEVAPGDVIFFPRKHLHTLQCVAPEGMDVVGLIHPGTNPGINY